MKQLKAWEQYVKDADREPLQLPVPDGALTITMPKGKALKIIDEAQRAGDLQGALAALVGDDNAATLLELFEEAPAGTLNRLMSDIAEEFGLGETGASSS